MKINNDLDAVALVGHCRVFCSSVGVAAAAVL